MRFDDRLTTILSFDHASNPRALWVWRQLIDLIARRQIDASVDHLAHLKRLRPTIPPSIRASVARSLMFHTPPARLVGFLANDERRVAESILHGVKLPAAAWVEVIAGLSMEGRRILAQRDDLPSTVVRALASLGRANPRLPAPDIAAIEAGRADPSRSRDIFLMSAAKDTASQPSRLTPSMMPNSINPQQPPLRDRQEGEPTPPAGGSATPIDAIDPIRTRSPELISPTSDGIDFRFDTDALGVIRRVDGVSRATLIGVSIATHLTDHLQGLVRVDPAASTAFRQRFRFAGLSLEVGGNSDAAGSWRIAGAPRFEPISGQFSGFSGIARRFIPPAEAGSLPTRQQGMYDGLRQLVHELRTPTNAVAGFAELIETQLLGPVPDTYRRRASSIRDQAADLLDAIDDLDTAARIEGGALGLRSAQVPLDTLAADIVTRLAPHMQSREATLVASGDGVIAVVDDRVAERLFTRLFAALISITEAGERINVAIRIIGRHAVVTTDRPTAFADLADDALFSLDGMASMPGAGAPLLGIGFTLRLVRNLARELGGDLTVARDRLVVRLPAAVGPAADHAAGH